LATEHILPVPGWAVRQLLKSVLHGRVQGFVPRPIWIHGRDSKNAVQKGVPLFASDRLGIIVVAAALSAPVTAVGLGIFEDVGETVWGEEYPSSDYDVFPSVTDILSYTER
jgi:hypothetical protein